MNKEELSKVITNEYNPWRKYAVKIAKDNNLASEAEDFLHDALYEVINNNNDKDIELTSVRSNIYDSIKNYVRKTIRNNCTLSQSSAKKAYIHYHSPLNHNIDPYQLEIQDEPVDTRIDQIWEVFDEMELQDEHRKIFIAYFKKGFIYKNCSEKYCLGKTYKIINEILDKIRKKLDMI